MLKSSSSHKNKKKSSLNQSKDELGRPRRSAIARKGSIRLRIHELGPICKSRKEDIDGDFDKLFEEEGWFDNDDDDNCKWLSSGTMSPSSCFDDKRFSILLDLSLDEWLVSLRPVVENSSPFVTFFDGSMINPIEEASLVLKRTSSNAEKLFQEDFKEEEVVSWLLSSIGNELPESSSTTCSNIDFGSQNWDLERTGFWVPLVNLEGDDSKWISDIDSELDSFHSSFPSPSSEVQSSNSSISSFSEVTREELQSIPSSEYTSEDLDLVELSGDEPIFWPSDGKSEWGLGVKWELFVMSPRKHMNKDRVTLEGNSMEPIRLSFHKGKLDFKEGCRRILELKHRNGNKDDARRTKTMPSRLGKSLKFSTKIVPIDPKDDVVEPTGEKVFGKYGNFKDEDFALNEELPIETLLGLDEFDGHEGIESEFNEDDFSLVESL